MTSLPEKIYLTRKEVLVAVGGRAQLEALEAGPRPRLRRHYPAGHIRARYVRAEVKRVLDDLGGRSS
jgi:hypothetical protein